MNSKVRTFLIKKAQQGETVYYNEVMSLIGLDHHYANDRKKIGEILGEITEFEHNNKRPLLSVIVVKNDRKKQPNKSFFNWAKELGYSFTEDSAFQNQQTKRCFDFWQNADNSIYLDQPEFFTEKDFSVLEEWANRSYDKGNSKHVEAREKIRDSLYAKTEYWARKVANRLTSFKYEGRCNPLKRGNPFTFQEYTWMRIMRIGDENKDIFFTVGADANEASLNYKLDIRFDDSSKLNAQQKILVKQNIPEDAAKRIIPVTEWEEYSWERLIQETVEFIQKYIADYDRLIALAWGNVKVVDINADADIDSSEICLSEAPPPEGIKSLPGYEPSFDGNGLNIDYEAKQRESTKLGNSGEILVKELEQKKLRDLGLNDLAAKVDKQPDGVGYDILSFDGNGDEIFIEVKTTTQGKDTPFDISLNEIRRFQQDQGKYKIYRLFGFNKKNTAATAAYYIIDDIKQLLLRAVNYKAFFKQQD